MSATLITLATTALVQASPAAPAAGAHEARDAVAATALVQASPNAPPAGAHQARDATDETSGTGRWLLTAGIGRDELFSDAIHWFGGELQPEGVLALERNLGDLLAWLPGLGVRLGIDYTGHHDDGFSLHLTELEAGITYQLGIADIVYPYVRVDALAGWAAIDIGEALHADAFVPGFGGAVGVRGAGPRIVGLVRPVVALETTFHLRATVVPRARYDAGGEGGAGKTALAGPSTPLGPLDPTGFTVRFLAGVEL